MNNKHLCAVCTRPINLGLLMCSRHWHLVPKDQQQSVYRAYRAMTRKASKPGGLDAVHAYRQAREAAIQSVESQITTTTTQEQQP